MPTALSGCANIILTKKTSTDPFASVLNATCKASDGTAVTSTIDLNSDIGVRFHVPDVGSKDSIGLMSKNVVAGTGMGNGAPQSVAKCPVVKAILAGHPEAPGAYWDSGYIYPLDGVNAVAAISANPNGSNWSKFVSQSLSGTTISAKVTGTVAGDWGGYADCAQGPYAGASLDLNTVVEVGNDGKLAPPKSLQFQMQGQLNHTVNNCTTVKMDASNLAAISFTGACQDLSGNTKVSTATVDLSKAYVDYGGNFYSSGYEAGTTKGFPFTDCIVKGGPPGAGVSPGMISYICPKGFQAFNWYNTGVLNNGSLASKALDDDVNSVRVHAYAYSADVDGADADAAGAGFDYGDSVAIAEESDPAACGLAAGDGAGADQAAFHSMSASHLESLL